MLNKKSGFNMPCREVAQLGRAPGSGLGGRGFKSRLPDRAYLCLSIDESKKKKCFLELDEVFFDKCLFSKSRSYSLSSTMI